MELGEKNRAQLEQKALNVELARKRYDVARAEAEKSAVELHEAKAALDSAEQQFLGFAWGAFGLPSPLDRFKLGIGISPKFEPLSGQETI